MLSEQEKIRYKRQIVLEDWGIAGQERLKNMTVFVAGAGGSGSPIITQLALLGVGHIKICDFDTVDLSNLNRQFLHCVSEENRLGMNKAVSAEKTVHNINPNIKVEIFQEKIDENNIDEMVGDAEILFDSVDKIDVKFMLSKCAIRKKIPHLFYGMMDINSFAVIFFPPKTPCFHCLYDFKKVKEMEEVATSSESIEKAVTPVCCPPVFMSAGFIVMEAIKILLNVGEPAYNTFYLFLQKGNEKIGTSSGYQGMKYWMTEHFKNVSLKSGFDWEMGWRGHLIEEIEIEPDPYCEYCGELHVKENQLENIEVDFNF